MHYSSDCMCGVSSCPLRSNGFRPYAGGNKKSWKYSFLQGKVIPFEGNIGVGKSSAAKETTRVLCEEYGLPAVYIPEYVDEELLKLFISNMKAYAYIFQLFMLERRAEVYRKAMELAKTGHIVIMDRMMHGDLVFALLHFEKGNFTKEQFDQYRNRLHNFHFSEPSLTIFLDCSPHCASTRAKKRNRSGETYEETYFEDVDRCYKIVMEKYQGQTLHVPYEENLLVEELTPKVKEILDACVEFLLQ